MLSRHWQCETPRLTLSAAYSLLTVFRVLLKLHFYLDMITFLQQDGASRCECFAYRFRVYLFNYRDI